MVRLFARCTATLVLPLLLSGGAAAESGAVLLASASGAFDKACANYYRQGNDPEVPEIAAADFCACLAEEFAGAGLGIDALDFYARTYSDDLTTFIHEYPEGEAWMQQSFQADTMCKTG